MLRLDANRPARFCDGLTRRDFLHAGALSSLGLTLPRMLSAIRVKSPFSHNALFGCMANDSLLRRSHAVDGMVEAGRRRDRFLIRDSGRRPFRTGRMSDRPRRSMRELQGITDQH